MANIVDTTTAMMEKLSIDDDDYKQKTFSLNDLILIN